MKRKSGRARVGKKAQSGRQSRASLASQRSPADAPISKYDQMTFFDPASRQVRRADGSTLDSHTGPGHVTTALSHAGSLNELPAALVGVDALYACEPGDEQSVKMLADAAGVTVMELEGRRRGTDTMAGLPLRCPPQLPQGRRWCWRCPHWKLDTRTPF